MYVFILGSWFWVIMRKSPGYWEQAHEGNKKEMKTDAEKAVGW